MLTNIVRCKLRLVMVTQCMYGLVHWHSASCRIVHVFDIMITDQIESSTSFKALAVVLKYAYDLSICLRLCWCGHVPSRRSYVSIRSRMHTSYSDWKSTIKKTKNKYSPLFYDNQFIWMTQPWCFFKIPFQPKKEKKRWRILAEINEIEQWYWLSTF